MESPFRIGDWLVEPQRDQRIKIEPRAMQVLVYLAEHPNVVVLLEGSAMRRKKGSGFLR